MEIYEKYQNLKKEYEKLQNRVCTYTLSGVLIGIIVACWVILV